MTKRNALDENPYAGWKLALLVAFMACAGFGADVTIPSTYDEASGKWIGDVVALTNALKNVVKNQTITLSKGEYDLSVLAEAPMVSDAGGYGTALIGTGAEKVTIRGETGNPKDVVLDGTGANNRLIYIYGANAGVMNVTIRGGHFAGAECARYNYRNGGGVVFASEGAFVSNCIFTACYSERAGGAASGPYNTHRGRVIDCLLFGNSTGHVGGGAIANCAFVSGCTVVSNILSTSSSVDFGGGGIKDATVVTNCYIAYNYSKGLGGGVFNCANVYDTVIEHNVADKSVGNDTGSGGAYGGKFHGCTFRDNCAASVSGAALMENCIVEDGCVNCHTNLNCVFRNLHNSSSYVWAKENVQYPDGVSVLSLYGFNGVELMRNCLITGCEWGYGSGKTVNLSLFTNVIGRVENCTIADNAYYHFGSGFKSGAAFVNCAIVRNTLDDGTTPSDVPLFESTQFCFSNCVWNVTGTRGATVVRDADYADGDCWVLGAGVSPKFLGRGECPYTPKCFSPLRERGMVLDWMAEATDLAGNPRLRDGKVDIGCYQCWLDPIGFSLSIR